MRSEVMASLIIGLSPVVAPGACAQEWQQIHLGRHVDAGAVAGHQFGYNWKRGRTVMGAEADIPLINSNTAFSGGRVGEDAITSLRLRAGRMRGETLLFGSLGVAWAEPQSHHLGMNTQSRQEPGFMLGGGAETFLGGKFSGRIEAYYVNNFGETSLAGSAPVADSEGNVIFRAGLSLNF